MNVSLHQGAATYTGLSERVLQLLGQLQLPADFIRPGDHIVLKPNWVKEHDERHPGPGHWEHVITHPTVIEAAVMWAAPRLQGKGRITLCDAPQTDSSFATLRDYCQLDALLQRCRAAHPELDIQLLDLRPEEWHAVDGVTVSQTALPGDPAGSSHVCLNEQSEFIGYHGLGRLYGASYDMAETNARHQETRHEYLLCRTPMDADVLINLPKLKTHKKVGLTCALKNMVGINSNKNWLPHHTEGTPDTGGDQFPSSSVKAKLEHSWMGSIKRILFGKRLLSRLFVPVKKLGRIVFGDTQNTIRSGNWQGNDTCWRMVLDLNKCLFHYDGSGSPRAKPLRYLAIADAIIAGEGNGPMSPDPKPIGTLLASTSPLALDTVAACLMGFDPQKLRLLAKAYEIDRLPLANFQASEIRVVTAAGEKGIEELPNHRFVPHFGWRGIN
jgi:uncharacterized protein (DUF362 family)